MTFGPSEGTATRRPSTIMCARGLTSEQASDALARFGPNLVPVSRAEPLWRKVVRATSDPLILVLVGLSTLKIR